jgi:regulator of RNase E activity RraA
MKLSTAQVCDALVTRPDLQAAVEIFTTELPIFSAGKRIQGLLALVLAGGDKIARRKEIADRLREGCVVLIENHARLDCSCLDAADIEGFKAAPQPKNGDELGVIVNGALRNTPEFAKNGLSVRALSVNPLPFLSPSPAMLEHLELNAFPFRQGGFILGDSDGLVVFRDRSVFAQLGLS